MNEQTFDSRPVHNSSGWLKRYYIVRFAFSAIWVALAFTIAMNSAGFAAALLIAYPIWDALANYFDGQRSGGLGQNKTQMLNLIVSGLTAMAVCIGLGLSMNAVVVIFGVWATLAGVLQLATAVRRWKSLGAQWAMILSGAQSAVAGFLFVHRASAPDISALATVAPYAGVGAFYFLISGVWLAVSDVLRDSRPTNA